MKKLKNHMEVIVSEKVNDLLSGSDCCTCNDCVLDIMAIALNELPSMYVVSDKGKLFSQVKYSKNQEDITVVTAVTRAIKVVQDRPKHIEKSKV